MKNVAAICTTWFTSSHADVLLRRWLAPEPTDAAFGWDAHDTRLSAVHVLKPCPEDDQAAACCSRHGLARAATIREAVRGGRGIPAADGVLVIAEHGDYPLNEFGQKLYPRREMFDEVLDTLEEEGRRLPIFVDKHLSWDPEAILHMDRRRRKAGLPLLSGSVLPWCRTDGALDGSLVADARRAVCLFYGGQEIYGFHALEFAQSLLEKRRGGETGVTGLQVWRSGAIREAVESPSRRALFEAAWEAGGGAPGEAMSAAFASRAPASVHPFYIRYSNSLPLEPVAFETTHADGLSVFYAMLPGAVSRFSLAVEDSGGRVGTTCAQLHGKENFHGHFAALAGGIANFMASGVEPHPPERNILTSLTLAAFMRALAGRDVDDIIALTAAAGYGAARMEAR